MEFKELIGKNLLGFMPLKEEEYKKGDWDNAIAIYVGKPNSPECYVIRTENVDYSCYDTWLIETPKFPLVRTSRYKAIGEKIIEILNISKRKDISDKWTEEKDLYWLFIKTKTKELRFGHHWYDCHYPNSIWEEVGR